MLSSFSLVSDRRKAFESAYGASMVDSPSAHTLDLFHARNMILKLGQGADLYLFNKLTDFCDNFFERLTDIMKQTEAWRAEVIELKSIIATEHSVNKSLVGQIEKDAVADRVSSGKIDSLHNLVRVRNEMLQASQTEYREKLLKIRDLVNEHGVHPDWISFTDEQHMTNNAHAATAAALTFEKKNSLFKEAQAMQLIATRFNGMLEAVQNDFVSKLGDMQHQIDTLTNQVFELSSHMVQQKKKSVQAACVWQMVCEGKLTQEIMHAIRRDPGKWDPPDELQLRFMRAATASSSSNLAGLPRSTVSAAQAPPRPGHRSVMAAPRASGTSRGADNMRFVQYNLSELIELRKRQERLLVKFLSHASRLAAQTGNTKFTDGHTFLKNRDRVAFERWYEMELNVYTGAEGWDALTLNATDSYGNPVDLQTKWDKREMMKRAHAAIIEEEDAENDKKMLLQYVQRLRLQEEKRAAMPKKVFASTQAQTDPLFLSRMDDESMSVMLSQMDDDDPLVVGLVRKHRKGTAGQSVSFSENQKVALQLAKHSKRTKALKGQRKTHKKSSRGGIVRSSRRSQGQSTKSGAAAAKSMAGERRVTQGIVTVSGGGFLVMTGGSSLDDGVDITGREVVPGKRGPGSSNTTSNTPRGAPRSNSRGDSAMGHKGSFGVNQKRISGKRKNNRPLGQTSARDSATQRPLSTASTTPIERGNEGGGVKEPQPTVQCNPAPRSSQTDMHAQDASILVDTHEHHNDTKQSFVADFDTLLSGVNAFSDGLDEDGRQKRAAWRVAHVTEPRMSQKLLRIEEKDARRYPESKYESERKASRHKGASGHGKMGEGATAVRKRDSLSGGVDLPDDAFTPEQEQETLCHDGMSRMGWIGRVHEYQSGRQEGRMHLKDPSFSPEELESEAARLMRQANLNRERGAATLATLERKHGLGKTGNVSSAAWQDTLSTVLIELDSVEMAAAQSQGGSACTSRHGSPTHRRSPVASGKKSHQKSPAPSKAAHDTSVPEESVGGQVAGAHLQTQRQWLATQSQGQAQGQEPRAVVVDEAHSSADSTPKQHQHQEQRQRLRRRTAPRTMADNVGGAMSRRQTKKAFARPKGADPYSGARRRDSLPPSSSSSSSFAASSDAHAVRSAQPHTTGGRVMASEGREMFNTAQSPAEALDLKFVNAISQLLEANSAREGGDGSAEARTRTISAAEPNDVVLYIGNAAINAQGMLDRTPLGARNGGAKWFDEPAATLGAKPTAKRDVPPRPQLTKEYYPTKPETVSLAARTDVLKPTKSLFVSASDVSVDEKEEALETTNPTSNARMRPYSHMRGRRRTQGYAAHAMKTRLGQREFSETKKKKHKSLFVHLPFITVEDATAAHARPHAPPGPSTPLSPRQLTRHAPKNAVTVPDVPKRIDLPQEATEGHTSDVRVPVKMASPTAATQKSFTPYTKPIDYTEE